MNKKFLFLLLIALGIPLLFTGCGPIPVQQVYTFPPQTAKFGQSGCTTIECSIREKCMDYIEDNPNDREGYEKWKDQKTAEGPYNYNWICRYINYP